MHELAVTQNILDIALRHAQGRPILGVNLVIGELSSIVDDSVQFYWEFITKNTLAAGSRLRFRRITAQMTCQKCGHTFHPREALACPVCDSIQVAVTAGDEFMLEAIDIAETDWEQKKELHTEQDSEVVQ